MLAKEQRIVRGEDFRRIVRSGSRAGSPLMVVHSTPAATATSRFGFIISKKVGTAVVRNRIRRRLAHIVRAALPLPEPRDVVVRVLPAAREASFATLRAEITPLMRPR